jgi:hypothetical protein
MRPNRPSQKAERDSLLSRQWLRADQVEGHRTVDSRGRGTLPVSLPGYAQTLSEKRMSFHTLIFCSVSDVSGGSRDIQPASRNTLSEALCLSPKPSISINQFGAAYDGPEMPDHVWPLPGFASPFNAIPAADFAWLLSSRLPTAQAGGSSDTSPNEAVSGISPTVRLEDKGGKGRVVKVTWWRPHGRTAIAPGESASATIVLGSWVLTGIGLKRTTLRVRLDDSQIPGSAQPGVTFGVTAELIGADGVPDQTIMRHLLDLFMVHFGCQFPFVERAKVERDIERQTGSVFLHNSIAAVAARCAC